MKQTINIKLLLAILLLITASCSDDYLDIQHSRYASAEVIPAAARLSGMYFDLFKYRDSHDDFGLRAVMLAADMMTDDIAYNSPQWFSYDYNLDNRGAAYRRPRSAWRTFYDGIRSANDIIATLKPEAGEELTDAKAKNTIGQAYTARAFFYFWLINMYQHPYQWNKEADGVPIITEEEEKLARQSVQDVYELMLSDIELGYSYLEGTVSKKGELNEFAAAAIYAKILSFVNDHTDQWNEVIKYADIAINGVELMDAGDFENLGFNNINIDKEVLWGVVIGAESGTFFASFMSHMDPYAAGYAGGLGQYKEPSYELVNAVDPNDVRNKWFEEIEVTIDDDNTRKVPISKKFKDVGGFESDYIYLRVAEMHFLKAEAHYLNGAEGEAKLALEAIMTVRQPGYTCSYTGQDLMDEIDLQKRIEMWGDGYRLFDLKRRNQALDRTGSDNHALTTPKNIPANDDKMIYQIPQVEVDANPDISPEDQNP